MSIVDPTTPHDPETASADLAGDLASPLRTVRLFALDQILRSGSGAALQEILQKRLPLESDPECLFLLKQALLAARQIDFNTQAAASIQDLRQRTPDDLKSLATDFPSYVQSKDNPFLLAEIITRMGQHVAPAHLKHLEAFLSHPYAVVRSATLDVFLERFPEEAGKRLVTALRSADPRLRALAVRGLARLDQREAERHLRLMLLGADPGLRRFGLSIAALLPFWLVRDALLQFILVADEAALRHTTAIFRSNPDREVPFRLAEMMGSPGEKRREWLRRLQELAIQALQSSGILGESSAAYFQHLADWQHHLEMRVKLREALSLIPEDSSDPAGMLADLLGEQKSNPRLPRLLQASLTWSLPDHLENAVKHLLSTTAIPSPDATPTAVPPVLAQPALRLAPPSLLPPSPSSSSSPSSPVSSSSSSSPSSPISPPHSSPSSPPSSSTHSPPFLSQPPSPSQPASAVPSHSPAAPPEDETQRRLAKLCISPPTIPGQALIQQVLVDKKASLEQQLLALRAAGAWEIAGFADLAEKLLSHEDPRVVAGALEYLTLVDPDRVIPRLGQFLAAGSPIVKLRAILLLKRYDLPQAISSLFALLEGPMYKSRHLLTTMLVQFEFSLLREPLTKFLCRTNGCVFLKESLCLFQANPAPENLFCLLNIERVVRPSQLEQVRKARIVCESALIELRLSTPEDLARLQQNWEEEQARLKALAAKPSPYSLEQVFPELDVPLPTTLLRSLRQIYAQADRQTVRRACIIAGIFGPLLYAYWAYILNVGPHTRFAPDLPPTLQRLARRPNQASAPRTITFTPWQTPPAQYPAAMFQDVLAREIARERTLPLPLGISREGGWLMQATSHPLFEEAHRQLKSGSLETAIRLLHDALADAPDNPFLQIRGWSILCHLYQKQKNDKLLKEAQERLAEASERLPAGFGVSLRTLIQQQEQLLGEVGKHSGESIIPPQETSP